MQQTSRTVGRGLLACVAAAGLMAGAAHADEINLPGTVIWSAYPTGSMGYAQAVAVGSVLQNEYGVNLRVVPGRNDIARLSPLRAGRVHFSAGGSEATYAQEGMMNFGTQGWGPQPIRIGLWSMDDGCAYTLLTTEQSGIETIEDVRGKRVTYVQGSPTLNNGIAALLAYGGLTWDDVQKVEVGGYMGTVEALIDGRSDVKGGNCTSPPTLRIASSPRGLRFIPFPHENEEGIARLQAQSPWYYPHVARRGPGVDPEEGIELFTSPYPVLTMMAEQDADLVYNVIKAMVHHHEDYKDSAPGAEGWALDRQGLEIAFTPFHEGAVRFYKEQGVWTEEAEARQQANLRRQEILQQAWADYTAEAPVDEAAFNRGWMEYRLQVLQEHELPVIMERW